LDAFITKSIQNICLNISAQRNIFNSLKISSILKCSNQYQE